MRTAFWIRKLTMVTFMTVTAGCSFKARLPGDEGIRLGAPFIVVGGAFGLLLQTAGLAFVARECVKPPKRFVRDAAELRFISPVVARGFVGLSLAGAL